MRVNTPLTAGEFNSRAMMPSCEVGNGREQLLTKTAASMRRQDDKGRNSANRRAIWKIGDQFGTDQADGIAHRLRNETATGVIVQRMIEAFLDIRLRRGVTELG
jgi:hypothetical protein